ncbi:unnamed protein product [Ophioblennius macclurei]
MDAAGGTGGDPDSAVNPQDISLQNEQKRKSNVVRIFVSSALTDMSHERRALLEKVTPEMLEFCRKQGLQFEMIDPCWGLRLIPLGDHETFDVLLEEIRTSRRVSAGPSFIALLGNRYGQRPLPHRVPEETFRVLVSRVSVSDLDGATLLRRWFLLDTNEIPPTYILQPVTAQFPYFADLRPEATPQRNKSVLAWRLTETRLLQLLRSAASQAEDAGDMIAAQTRDFYTSVLEQELEAGLFTEPGSSVLTVLREDPRQTEGPRRLSRLLHAVVDCEGRDLMVALKSRLHATPRLRMVELSGGGVDPRRLEHTRYLSDFCKEVTAHLKAELSGCHGDMVKDKEESWQHAEICTRLANGVLGRDELLQKLRLAISEDGASWHRPLVVHGGAGMGKTALLCRLVCDELASGTEVVVRLIAARHPLAPDVDDIITDVCLQVCLAFQLAPPPPAAALVRRFMHVLTEASRHGCSLLVVLDSLDSLSDCHHAKKLRWLPTCIPPNVHLLISVDDGGVVLANARLRLDDERFFHVGQLSRQDCEQAVKARLHAARRKLTAEQHVVVGQSLEASGCPLHVWLVAAMAVRWKSFTAEAELQLGADVQEMLKLTMLMLERKHGRELVGGALGYLALAREGLQEAELRDLLSLDDDIISEVYRHSPPPSPSLIRLPPLLWSCLHRDLRDFLEERWTRGTILLAFSSRRVCDFVVTRYLTPERKGRSHRNMADYFLGRWAGKLKPASLPGLSLVLSDRKVPPQPLWFAPGLANVRKMKELPYHLLHADMWEELQQEVIGNADFLFSKTQVCGISSVTSDLDHIAKQLDCAESALIRDALVLFQPSLDFLQGHIDGSLFHTELLARLSSLAVEFPGVIGRLCIQCEERLLENPEPVLIPKGSFLQQPGGALTHTLTALKGGVVCLDVSIRLKMLATGVDDGVLAVWSLEDQHLIHILLGHTASVLSVRLIDSSAHCLSLAADSSLRRWSLIGGEQLLCVEGAGPVDPGPSLTLHLDLNQDLLFVYTRTQVKGWMMDGLELRPLSIGNTEGAELVLGILGNCVVSLRNFNRIRVSSVAGESKATETAVEPPERQLMPEACVTLPNRGKVFVVSKQGFLHQISASGENSSAEFLMNTTLLTVTEDEKVLLAGVEFSLYLYRVSVATVTLFLHLPHEDVVLSVCVSSDRRLVATGAADQLVRVWSVTTGALLDALIGSDAPVTALRFYYNFLLSAAAAAPTILVWNTKYDTRHRPTPRIPADSAHTTLTQDGDRVFYVRELGHMEVSSWSSQTGLLDQPLAVSAAVNVLEFLQQKRVLVCGLDGGTVLMFPLAQPQETIGIPPPESTSRVLALAACAQEQRLVVAHEDAARLFALGSRDGVLSVEGPLQSVPLSLLHAPLTAMTLLAGERLLYGTACGAVALCGFMDGVTCELEPHRATITCVTAGKGGVYAFVGSEDAIQRLWALEPLTLEHTMEYKGLLFEGILCASFSDCDRFIFTGSKDRTLKVWDVGSGQLLYVQYVYSPVVRVLGTRSGLLALTRQGSIIREMFHCPEHISPNYNPLRNIGNACASYCVTSRDKNRDWDQNRADLQDFNPAQLQLMSLLRAKPSATCCLL